MDPIKINIPRVLTFTKVCRRGVWKNQMFHQIKLYNYESKH